MKIKKTTLCTLILVSCFTTNCQIKSKNTSKENLWTKIERVQSDTINLFTNNSKNISELMLMPNNMNIFCYNVQDLGFIFHEIKKDSVIQVIPIDKHNSMAGGKIYPISLDSTLILYPDKYINNEKNNILYMALKSEGAQNSLSLEAFSHGYFMHLKSSSWYFKNQIFLAIGNDRGWYNSCDTLCNDVLIYNLIDEEVSYIDFLPPSNKILPKTFSYPVSMFHSFNHELLFYFPESFNMYKYDFNEKKKLLIRNTYEGLYNLTANQPTSSPDGANNDLNPNDDFYSAQIMGGLTSPQSQNHIVSYFPPVPEEEGGQLLYVSRPVIHQIRTSKNRVLGELSFVDGDYPVYFNDSILIAMQYKGNENQVIINSYRYSFMNIRNKDSLKNILHLRYKYKYKTSTAIKKQIQATIFNTSYSQGALLVPASTACEGCVNQVLDYVKRNKDTLDYRKLHVIIVAESYEEAQSLMQKNGLNEILWRHISYKQYSSLSDRMGFRPILLLERAEKGITTTTLDPDALQHLDKKIRFKYFK